MPGRKGQEGWQHGGRAVEEGVEAGGELVVFELGAILKLHDESDDVGAGRFDAIGSELPDVAPARGCDAASALPERESGSDDDDASVVVCRGVERLLAAKPGRLRTCSCEGSRMTATMLS